MTHRPLMTTLAAVAVAATAACTTTAPGYSPGYYPPPPAPVTSYSRPAPYADEGVVRAIDVIPVASRPSGAGAILGAIVGGVAGNAVEQRTRRDDEVYRVSVRFNDGSIRDFDYQQVGSLRVGDRVRLVDGQLHMLQ